MLNSQKGVTLIEIMIAMLLFGVGLSLAMRTLPDSNRATNRGRNITKASNLAQEKLEELLAITYNDADLVAGTHNDQDNPIDNHFRRSWTVVDDTPIQDIKSVTVVVSFDTASKDSSVTLATLITNRR